MGPGRTSRAWYFHTPDYDYHCILQGLHPRLITEGFELARNKALEVLEDVKIKREVDRDTLIQVARTSLRTKVHQELADLLTEVGRIKIDVGTGSVSEKMTGTL